MGRFGLVSFYAAYDLPMSVAVDSPAAVDAGLVGSPEAAYQYRALNSAAVAAAVLGVLSSLCFLSWFLAIIPFFGLLIGVYAIKQVRTRSSEFTGLGLARAGVFLSAVLWAGGWSALAYDYATEVPEGFERVSYAALQPEDPNARLVALPTSATALDNKKIFIKGFMYPGTRTHGIQEFLLCRDKGDCCFGGNPKITDRLLIHLPAGQSIDQTSRQIEVWGEFHVASTHAPDGLGGGVVYQLDAAGFRD